MRLIPSTLFARASQCGSVRAKGRPDCSLRECPAVPPEALARLSRGQPRRRCLAVGHQRRRDDHRLHLRRSRSKGPVSPSGESAQGLGHQLYLCAERETDRCRGPIVRKGGRACRQRRPFRQLGLCPVYARVDGWFALNLDPDGSSFWSGSFNVGILRKFNISSGALLEGIGVLALRLIYHRRST